MPPTELTIILTATEQAMLEAMARGWRDWADLGRRAQIVLRPAEGATHDDLIPRVEGEQSVGWEVESSILGKPESLGWKAAIRGNIDGPDAKARSEAPHVLVLAQPYADPSLRIA